MMPKVVDHETRRTEIANAAARAVDEYGLDRVRLIDVARAAGCTTGSIGHYFPGKDAVLVAALEHALAGIVDSGAEVTAGTDFAGASAFISHVCTFLPLTEPNQRYWRIWLAFCGRAAHDPQLARMHQRAYAELQRGLLDGISTRGLAHGSGPGDPEDTAAAVMAVLDGVGLRAVLEPEEWPADRQRGVVSTLLSALLASSGATTSSTQTNARQEKAL